MKRRYLPVIVLLLILAVSTPAFANVYVPSLVQIVTGPLLWSWFIVTLIITIPVIFIISLIEALVLRRYVQGKKLRQLIFRLAAINALTSLIGQYFTWPGTNIWPGSFIAFMLTALVEALLMWLWNPGIPIPKRLGTFLKASTYMNAASYAALAMALLAMIYLPTWGKENPALLKSVSGTLLAFDGSYYMLIHLKSKRSPDLKRLETSFSPRTSHFNVTADNRLQILSANGTLTKLRISNDALQKESETHIPKLGDALAISPDGKLVLYSKKGKSFVFNITSNQVVLRLPSQSQDIRHGAFSHDNRFLFCTNSQAEAWLADIDSVSIRNLGNAYFGQFSPTRDFLALDGRYNKIELYDCLKGKRQAIEVSFGSIDTPPRSFTWSPDGQVILYLGQRNTFTAQNWHRELIALSATGKGSITIQEYLYTLERPFQLFWLP